MGAALMPQELSDDEVFGLGGYANPRNPQAQAGQELTDDAVFAVAQPPVQGARPGPVYNQFVGVDDQIPEGGYGPQSGMEMLNDRARAFARGVPIVGALADEADAVTGAALAPWLQPMMRGLPGYNEADELNGDFGERYRQAKAMQDRIDRRFDDASPEASRNYQIGGTVVGTLAGARALAPLSAALGPGASLLTRVGAGAAEGGGLGALQGFVSGDGSLGDASRLEGAKTGALWGAVAGGAVPVVAGSAETIWNSTGRKVLDAIRGPVRVSKAERLAKLLEQMPEGATAADIDAAAARSAIPEVEARGSQVSGAYDRIARELERQGLTPEQAMQRARDLGPYGTLADVGEGTRDLARSAANAPGPAGQISRDALDLRQRGTIKDGEFSVRPSSTRLTDDAAELMGVSGRDYLGEVDSLIKAQKAAAGPAYAKAYEAAPVSVGAADAMTGARMGGELSQFANSRLFKQAYERARRISDAEFVKNPDDVALFTGQGEAIKPLPEKIPEKLDWRTLDLVKQGLDDLIKTGPVEGIGASEQNAIKGFLKRYVDKLDSLNPDYKSARNAFAGPARVLDAMEEGRGFLREDAAVTAKNLADLPESEREAFRIGALQALKGKLGDADVTYDAARKAGFLKPNQLERFKAIFPNQETFATFANRMAAEQRMFETRGAVLGNSTTAKQLARAEDVAENPLAPVINAAMAAKTGGLSSVAQMGARMLKGGGNKLDEGTSKALAAILLDMNPANQAQTLKGLNAAQRRRMASLLWKGTGQAEATQGAAAYGLGQTGD